MIILLANGVIVYGQTTQQNVERNDTEADVEKVSEVYMYPKYREDMHAEELAIEIKKKLGYKLMAEYEGDKVDGSVTVGDEVRILMPKLSEKEKLVLDEIVKSHYSKSIAEKIKVDRQYQYADDLVDYTGLSIEENIDTEDLGKEIKSKLDAQENVLDGQFIKEHHSQKAVQRGMDGDESSSSNCVSYSYPRYRQEMHAGDLALEIKKKLGYKLMAEYEGDKVDGSVTVGDEVRIVMFNQLTLNEKSILDQIVVQHYSKRAAEVINLHNNAVMAVEMTYPRMVLQIREPYGRTVQRMRLPGVIEDIEIELIRPSSRPLRINIGRVEDLILSIKEKGLLQPIIVRPCINEFEVVAGNRRLEACRILEWKKVPCLVIEIDDKEAFEISLIENIQRNSMNPIEEALAFKKYVEDYGWGGISDLARRIGKSASYVSRRIRLLDLPYNVQEEIVKQTASVGILQEVLALEDEFTRGELAELIVRNNLERNDVRRIVKHIRNIREDEAHVSNSHQDLADSYDTALKKSIAVLKITLIRLDEIINSISTDSKYSWIFRELLLENRRTLHRQIDFLYKLRKKIRKFRM